MTPRNETRGIRWLTQMRERGVLRVAASYAVIAWLLLQVGSVVLEPMGAPAWVMRALIALSLAGFPVSILLAWFFELGPRGVEIDRAPADDHRPRATGWRRYADVAVIGILALTVIFLLLRDSKWLQPDRYLIGHSLAVLPFQNSSGNAADAYVASGFADELRRQLARVPSLEVISRLSSEAVGSKEMSAPDVAAKLGVAALVEGSIRRDKDRLRISVALVDGRDGKMLWSEDFDRTSDSSLDVQSEIAQAIVGAILPEFTDDGSQIPAPATTVVAAQDLYMLAHSLERDAHGGTREAQLLKARALYEQAVAADPRYALAHAALGRVILSLEVAKLDGSPEDLDRLVLPHVEQATKLDPTLADAYLVKGALLRATLRPGGEQMYRMAAELNPNDELAQDFLSGFELNQNRPAVSLEHALRARDLDPMRPLFHWKVVEGLANVGLVGELPRAVSRANDLFGAEARYAALACEANRASGAHDKALACILAGLKRFPDAKFLADTVIDACFGLGDLQCESRLLQRAITQGDAEAALWLAVIQQDRAAIEQRIRPALGKDLDYGQGFTYCLVAMAAGLDDLALDAWKAARLQRATADGSMQRADAMNLLPDIVLLLRSRSKDPTEPGRMLDAALEWTARGLTQGGRSHHYHLHRAQALAVAGRMDEAVAEVRSAASAPDAPFNPKELTDLPSGRLLLTDPRVPPLLQAVAQRQQRLLDNVPVALAAAGLRPTVLAAIDEGRPLAEALQ